MDGQQFLLWVMQTGLHRIVWTSDLDWTIVDNTRPDGAPAPAGTVESIRRLDEASAGFYLNTGRDIKSVDIILPGADVKVSAEYNNMTRFDPPQTVSHSTVPQWNLIDTELDAITATWPGAILRKKDFMRTLNFSKAPGLQRPDVRDAVRREMDVLLEKIYRATGQSIANIDGGSVFDLTPAGRDKDTGQAQIFEHAERGYRMKCALEGTAPEPLVMVYFGDSPGDLPAARRVQAHGGKFVSVGSDPRVTSIADFRLENVAACRAVMAAAPPASGIIASLRNRPPSCG